MRRALAMIALLASALAPRAAAELAQKDGVRVAVTGGLSPKRLPRTGTAPVAVTIGGHISSTSEEAMPQLQAISFAFNKGGQLDLSGPRCRLGRIDPSTSEEALAACRSSLVGEGRFQANVRFPEQSPFPSRGKVLAFNGVLRGRPVVFVHVYGTRPVPTSYVLPLAVRRAKGTFATRLEGSLAGATGRWGYVTGLSLKLGKSFTSHGQRHSFLSAGCPAPRGFPGALFPLLKTSFSFLGGTTVTTTLTRSCEVRGR